MDGLYGVHIKGMGCARTGAPSPSASLLKVADPRFPTAPIAPHSMLLLLPVHLPSSIRAQLEALG